MSEWRDIETAPKDGAWVLLWLPTWGYAGQARMGRWDFDGWYGREWKEVFYEPSHWQPVEPPRG